MKDLTDKELVEVTEAFIERLSDGMDSAGCNELFDDEFSKSICKKFEADTDLLDAWKRKIMILILKNI